jgi:hypothetical protein
MNFGKDAQAYTALCDPAYSSDRNAMSPIENPGFDTIFEIETSLAELDEVPDYVGMAVQSLVSNAERMLDLGR